MNGHPEREKKLAAVTAAHDDWEAAHLSRAQFDPARAAAKTGSDYNQHHLDVHPPAGAEDDFHRRVEATRPVPREPAAAAAGRQVKDLSGLIRSATGRETAVRSHLHAATAALGQGDAKTAYGALDLARRYATGEFGDNPERPVLLADKTEAWRSITRLRDSLRAQARQAG